MSEPKPFIRVDKHGAVTITGGVVFCANTCVEVEAPTERARLTPPVLVNGTAFYTTLPKWWQVLKWFRLLQVLRGLYK